MSGFGTMWEVLMPDICRTLGETAGHPGRGETVILRRPSTLEDVEGDVTPAQLALAADAAAEAVLLHLELPGGRPLAGKLLAGARLALGSVEYSITAEAATALNSIAVAIVPPLAAPLAAGSLLTLHPESALTFLNCHVSRKITSEIARQLQGDTSAIVTIPSRGAPGVPMLEDAVELEDGTIGRVASIPITTSGFWKIRLGH